MAIEVFRRRADSELVVLASTREAQHHACECRAVEGEVGTQLGGAGEGRGRGGRVVCRT